jgi:aspartokinase-like uncharacterized kinase
METVWVVKIGGSLSRTKTLPGWLQAIERHGGGKIVIVPGGGPFADQVWESQQHWKFSEVAAHRMALLAMQQYGLMMQGLYPSLETAEHVEELLQILRRGRVAVWMPYRLASQELALPTSWELSSDSLAAWLAMTLGASRLLLVKSVMPPASSLSARRLAAQGMVDPLFPGFLRRAACPAWICCCHDYRDLPSALASGHNLGLRVTVD